MDGPAGHYPVVFSLDRPPLLAVYILAQLAEFCAHHCRANNVNRIRPSKIFVTSIGVAVFFAAPNHIDIELRDDLRERNRRIVREIARSPQALFFAAMPDK